MILRLLLVNLFFASGLAAMAQWSELGSGMNDGVRRLLHDSVSQRVYAFGHFSTAGGLLVNGTAYWEDEAWHAMGQGVHYPQAFPVLAANFWGDSILISGYFPYAYDVANSQRVAIWDGNAWGAIEPGGVIGSFQASIVTEDGLIVGGLIDTIAGVPIVNNLARYTNGAWLSACVHPTDGLMWFGTVVRYQDKLILGGNLNSPTLRELCWLDGDTLRRVGQGIFGDAWVNDLLEYQGKLYIAGEYYAGAGNAATGLSTWDGQGFADPFPGVHFITQAIDLDVRNGELYFSGRTWMPGSTDYYTLGRYDGERLCLFGKNLNTVFLTIAATEEYLYVAPNMLSLGLYGDTVNYIARWDLSYPADTCIQLPTGIGNETSASRPWRIGPNPCSDRLIVECASGFPPGASLLVFDALGRPVSSALLPVSATAFTTSMDERSSGIVFVAVVDRSGRPLVRSRILVIQP